MNMKRIAIFAALLLALPAAALAQIHYIPAAGLAVQPKKILPLSPVQKASIAQKLLNSSVVPTLGAPIDLTVSNPYSPNGAYVMFLSPQTVLPDAKGGFAGLNSQDLNPSIKPLAVVRFTAQSAKPYMIDCSLAGPSISYRIDESTNMVSSGTTAPSPTDNHTVFIAPAAPAGTLIGLTLWTTGQNILVYFGCEITPVG